MRERPHVEFEMTTRTNADNGVVFSEQHRFIAPKSKEGEITAGHHRTNGPAIVYRNPDTGDTLDEHFFFYGRLSRVDGPASIKRDPRTLVVTQEDFAIDGRYHRIGGPARIARDAVSGRVCSEAYYFNGKPHREDGPAFVVFDEHGKMLRADFFIHGREFTEQEFRKRQLLPERSTVVNSWRESTTSPISGGASEARRARRVPSAKTVGRDQKL
ncbi:MAG: hypothetical protein F9K29_18275 [Hyphomicrobiaceae bacterium]|nr:MAG: hypothetical protein F9K29_18275 [Hyphomicrobiaceae bacterium]